MTTGQGGPARTFPGRAAPHHARPRAPKRRHRHHKNFAHGTPRAWTATLRCWVPTDEARAGREHRLLPLRPSVPSPEKLPKSGLWGAHGRERRGRAWEGEEQAQPRGAIISPGRNRRSQRGLAPRSASGSATRVFPFCPRSHRGESRAVTTIRVSQMRTQKGGCGPGSQASWSCVSAGNLPPASVQVTRTRLGGKPVTRHTCHMALLSHSTPVTWYTSHTVHLSYSMPVTRHACHMACLSHSTPVTRHACHTVHLSYSMPVTRHT